MRAVTSLEGGHLKFVIRGDEVWAWRILRLGISRKPAVIASLHQLISFSVFSCSLIDYFWKNCGWWFKLENRHLHPLQEDVYILQEEIEKISTNHFNFTISLVVMIQPTLFQFIISALTLSGPYPFAKPELTCSIKTSWVQLYDKLMNVLLWKIN